MPRHHDATTEERRLLIQRPRIRTFARCERTRNRGKPALTQVALDGRASDLSRGAAVAAMTKALASPHEVSGAAHMPHGIARKAGVNRVSEAGAAVTAGQQVKLTATGAVFQMAQLQKHNDIANRKDIVKAISVAKAAANATKTKDLDRVYGLFPRLAERREQEAADAA